MGVDRTQVENLVLNKILIVQDRHSQLCWTGEHLYICNKERQWKIYEVRRSPKTDIANF